MMKEAFLLTEQDDISYTEVDGVRMGILVSKEEEEVFFPCSPETAEKLAKELLECIALYKR